MTHCHPIIRTKATVTCSSGSNPPPPRATRAKGDCISRNVAPVPECSGWPHSKSAKTLCRFFSSSYSYKYSRSEYMLDPAVFDCRPIYALLLIHEERARADLIGDRTRRSGNSRISRVYRVQGPTPMPKGHAAGGGEGAGVGSASSTRFSPPLFVALAPRVRNGTIPFPAWVPCRLFPPPLGWRPSPSAAERCFKGDIRAHLAFRTKMERARDGPLVSSPDHRISMASELTPSPSRGRSSPGLLKQDRDSSFLADGPAL